MSSPFPSLEGKVFTPQFSPYKEPSLPPTSSCLESPPVWYVLISKLRSIKSLLPWARRTCLHTAYFDPIPFDESRQWSETKWERGNLREVYLRQCLRHLWNLRTQTPSMICEPTHFSEYSGAHFLGDLRPDSRTHNWEQYVEQQICITKALDTLQPQTFNLIQTWIWMYIILYLSCLEYSYLLCHHLTRFSNFRSSDPKWLHMVTHTHTICSRHNFSNRNMYETWLQLDQTKHDFMIFPSTSPWTE